MIRKLIIVVLTLGVVGTVVLLVCSFNYPSRGAVRGPLDCRLIPGAMLFYVEYSRISGEPPTLSGSAFAGFTWGTVMPANTVFFVIRVPLPHLIILLAVYPVVALALRRPLRRRRRRRRGLCVGCGYNLTGNVSRVCPECGEAI